MRAAHWIILLLCGACSQGDDKSRWGGGGEEPVFAVRVQTLGRGKVRDTVRTTRTLEAERRVDVVAEAEGRVKERVRDVGDPVGQARNGEDPHLLARLDDRELAFTVKEAKVTKREADGKVRELELAVTEATEKVAEAKVALAEAEQQLIDSIQGEADGTTSKQTLRLHRFARDKAKKRVATETAAKDRADVALELGRVAVEKANLEVERATHEHQKTWIRSPLEGNAVVTSCSIRVGQHIKKGDLLYTIADPTSLVAYARVPIQDASRIEAGDEVEVRSTTTRAESTGEVLRVAPTVNPEGGTLEVKIRVKPARGMLPGLYLSLEIVVDTRPEARVLPKKAVLYDDERGPFVFVVRERKREELVMGGGLPEGERGQEGGGANGGSDPEDGDRKPRGPQLRAERVFVDTGFESRHHIEILKGIGDGDRVVVEGQDTLSEGAKVKIQEEPAGDTSATAKREE